MSLLLFMFYCYVDYLVLVYISIISDIADILISMICTMYLEIGIIGSVCLMSVFTI